MGKKGRGSGKRRSKKELCKARSNFRTSSKKPCKVCDACKDDPEKCTLYPYDPNCCKGKKPKMTPHHVIAGHCFRLADGTPVPGAEKYKYEDAPCICAVGGGKVKTHKKLHNKFDSTEDGYKENAQGALQTKGVWTYEEARQAGADAVTDVFPQCTEKCIKAQLDEYHQDKAKIKDNTPLRADSSGKAKPAAMLSKTATGMAG